MTEVIVAKFGGSTIGQNGDQIPTVIERIKAMRKEEKKIVAVFSAPLMEHEGKVKSMTDIAIHIGRKYASGQTVDTNILYRTYLNIIDGVETTYEWGGSDRTAADIAIILYDEFKVQIDFEKDNILLSADPKIVKEELESIRYLSYNEARLAGMFGMKILDPIAIKEIDDNNFDIPIVITSILNPSDITIIEKSLINRKHDFLDSVEDDDNDDDEDDSSLIKIVTGKRNCVIVRMESIAASYLIASLEKDKRYYNFLKLSPFKVDDIEITRLLFLDADYVKRHERHFKAFYPKVEFAYGKGVVTLIGDMMWKMPKIVSTASRTVGDYDINILNLDAQEETSRILIIVDDIDNNVANAIRAIHLQRNKAALKITNNKNNN